MNLLITNSHIIPQKIIDLKNDIVIVLNDGTQKIIELNKEKRFIKCLEAPIDIIAIEILDEDMINNDDVEFLSHDLNYEDGYNDYLKVDIYCLFPIGKDIEYASGKIIKINNNREYEFEHTIDIDFGFSGSPLILAGNYRVVGIYKGKNNNSNLGSFIGILLKEINNSSNNIQNSSNKKSNNIKYISKEIEKGISINPKNINYNKLIAVYKITNNNKIRIFGDKFVDNNKDNFLISLNGKNIKLCTYIDRQLIKDTKLKIELKEIKTVFNMSYIFENCESLLSISDESEWDFSKVKDMRYMFCGCTCLTNITNNISKWNTSNVIDMSGMFHSCSSLFYLPNISNWNTSNVKKMAGMFHNCSSLLYFPDISNWDTSNVTDMLSLFSNCSSLLSLPDISKWNVSNVTNMNRMFSGCSSLTHLPDISKWDVSNVNDMNFMFYNCRKLLSIPDLTKWNFSIYDFTTIFDKCDNLDKKYINNLNLK